MSDIEVPPDTSRPAVELRDLSRYTLVAAALAACLAEAALAIPASLTGLFQQDIGPTSSQLTWISDAFLVPVSLFELTFGVLGDLFGRKRLLIIGALLLAVGEAVVFLSPGAGAAAGTRVLVIFIGQSIAGIGAGALFPTSLAMIAAGTHTAPARARGIAVWVAGFTFGAFIGPVIGGVAAAARYGADANAGWRWAFLVILVLALVSAAISAGAQDSRAPEGRSLDWAGQVTIAIALFALLFAVIQGPTTGWGSAPVTGGFILAAVFLAAFAVAELRSPAPLLQLSFFRHRSFAAVSAVTVIGMFAFLGTVYAVSVRLSTIQGFSPLKTSVASVLLVGMMLLMLPVAPRLLLRYNPKWVLGAGLAVMGAGDVWLAATSGGDVSYGAIAAPLLIVGVGIALTLASFTAAAVNGMPTHLAGMASGANNMLRDLGATLGPAVIGAVALSRAAAKISAGVAASPALGKAVAAFYAAPAHAPAAQRPALEGAVHAVQSGPLGANGVPATVVANGHVIPFNPLHDVAYSALTSAYSLGYVICAVAAFAAALLACTTMSGRAHSLELAQEAPGRLSTSRMFAIFTINLSNRLAWSIVVRVRSGGQSVAMPPHSASRLAAGDAPAASPELLDRAHPEADIARAVRAYSNWGRWGADDVLGTVNFITDDLRRRAAGLVRRGASFSLSQRFDSGGPQQGWRRRTNPVHTMLDTGTDAAAGNQGFPHGIGGADDVIAMPLQCSTQWDGLGHIFDHGQAWNGRDAARTVTSDGDLVTGIEHLARPVCGRGVLLDVGRVTGPALGTADGARGELPDGFAITEEHLAAAAAAHGVSVGRGDLVLVRTGRSTRELREGWGGYAGGAAPGLSFTTAGWLHRTEIAAVATDTWGFEVRPNEFDDAFQPLHQVAIPHLGLLIGEMWALEELAADCAADGVYEFFLTAAPLPITGAVGSPVNPIAVK